ncbi:MAG: hypothetical protein KDA84_12375, partial [Planctomycetaceae bacterium]|nr:hypothetical protein [Planctomycetaceae bacterium]
KDQRVVRDLAPERVQDWTDNQISTTRQQIAEWEQQRDNHDAVEQEKKELLARNGVDYQIKPFDKSCPCRRGNIKQPPALLRHKGIELDQEKLDAFANEE